MSAKQELVIGFLAAGSTMSDAAAQAGVGRRTVYAWLHGDARFAARLNEEQRALAERVTAERDALVTAAFQTLRDLLKPDAPATIRLRAAESVLRTFGPPRPPAYGPDDPAEVEAAWEAARAKRERDEALLRGWEWAIESRPPARFDSIS